MSGEVLSIQSCIDGVIELAEDIVIPKGTKFGRCAKSEFPREHYSAVIDDGAVDSVLYIIVTDDFLEEQEGKFK